jgi:Protein of unknown function (DUF2612)
MGANPNAGFGFGPFGAGRFGNEPVQSLPIGDYLALVPSQLRGRPKFMAWLAAALQPLDDLNQCLATFNYSFDLDSAQGAQLDILGQIIGQSRTVGFQPSGGVSPTLDDPTYRLLLRASIAKNSWDGTIDALQSTWQQLFPGGRIAILDNQDMSATVILAGAFSSIVVDLINNGYIVPEDATVKYTYIFPILPVLGLDANDDFISGPDLGHWS